MGAVPLEGSNRNPPIRTRPTGPADPDEQVELTLCLRRRPSGLSLPALPCFSLCHPSRRQYLAIDQIAARFGAAPEDATIVQNAIAAAGFEVVETNLARRIVRVRGPAVVLGRYFGTELAAYGGPGGPFRGRVGGLTLPDSLAGLVIGVFGLDNRPQLRTHFRRPRVAGFSYAPGLVAAAYSFPPGADGTGQTIGILEFGGGYRPEDLKTFFAGANLPVPTVNAVSVDGAGNVPTGDPNGPDGEVELDVEVSGAVAPGARIVVYFAPNSDQGFLDALSAAIHDTVNRPSVISISWGGPESTWTAQARAVFEQSCEDAAALGITVLAAAGDSGATDGEPAGTLAVDFPASAPYVVGCGGTRLLLNGTTITEETVWNELADGEGATGGGVSQVFGLPTYQGSAGVPPGDGGFKGRGVPDVSGDADPTTGYAVVVDGAPTTIGGTSAVAPLWAGLIARLNQAIGAPLGFLQPLIYATPESGTFHDITSGNNGGFDAGPGWDACTGLGSPDGTALLAAIQRR